MNGLYSTHDAARILQVHPFTVAKWIDRGELKAWRTAGGHRRVQAADLKTYLVEHGLPVPLELNGAGSRLRLLVVDPDARSRRAIQRDFEKLETEVVVTTSSSGVDSVLLIAETRPDVVFFDLDVPDVDALDVFRQVRGVAALDSVTLLAMTSHHTPKVAAVAAKAGAALCLAKPFNAESVVRLIRGARPAGRPRIGKKRRAARSPSAKGRGPVAVVTPARPPVAVEQPVETAPEQRASGSDV